MSKIERLFKLITQAKTPLGLPKGISPTPKQIDVRTIRLVQTAATTAACIRNIVLTRMVDFKKMAIDPAALVDGLKRVEKEYGTVAAFTLGALLVAGITDPKELAQNALKLDVLFGLVKREMKGTWSLSEQDKIARIREALWLLAPNRYAGLDMADNFELNKVLDKYLQSSSGPIGDCVSLTLIDSLMFMKFGIAIGVRAYSNHICSTTTNLTFDNTIRDFSEASRLHAQTGETDKTLNYLGFMALLYNCRGNYLSYQGKIDEAQKAFDLALELLPDCATIYNNRANHKCLKKDYAGAGEDYQRAILLEPNPYFYIGRAIMYLEMGETAKGIQDIQKAYELDPNNPDYQDLFKRLGLAPLRAEIIPRLIVAP